MIACLFVFAPYADFASAEKKQDNDFLLGVLFEAQGLREKAMAEIKKLDLEIMKNEQTMQQSQNIIRLAQQRDDAKARQAEVIARKGLTDAQDAKKKNEDVKKLYTGFKKVCPDT